ncbi:hypothetical protein BDV96DRAFT_593168 [Lophiotrema nucula]|uniref:Uncharacterized protein n=1 Tax=Lophiotrema nucula TaxID=690887 RepID=A0A6A5ZUU2_9PLEO|nr:hypothetical protein BDV96DRAFT_593168 [Lophiotrema nucula]
MVNFLAIVKVAAFVSGCGLGGLGSYFGLRSHNTQARNHHASEHTSAHERIVEIRMYRPTHASTNLYGIEKADQCMPKNYFGDIVYTYELRQKNKQLRQRQHQLRLRKEQQLRQRKQQLRGVYANIWSAVKCVLCLVALNYFGLYWLPRIIVGTKDFSRKIAILYRIGMGLPTRDARYMEISGNRIDLGKIFKYLSEAEQDKFVQPYLTVANFEYKLDRVLKRKRKKAGMTRKDLLLREAKLNGIDIQQAMDICTDAKRDFQRMGAPKEMVDSLDEILEMMEDQARKQSSAS